MIVAFCGHSEYTRSDEGKKTVIDYLEKASHGGAIDFFLGEYGEFDRFAYDCASTYKENHPSSRLTFVTPYISENYLKNKCQYERFDGIIYPELENIPPRYAISRRNKWMAEQADIIVAYVLHEYGGAFEMYRYAKRKGKIIFNLASENQ